MSFPQSLGSPSGSSRAAPATPADWATPPGEHVERRVWAGLLAFAVVLVASVTVAVAVLAGAQAYVRAEGFYVKGQLLAAHHVGRFAETGDRDDLERARRALRAPEAYWAFRISMDQPSPDVARARRLLGGVGHAPAEARGMIRLYPVFRRVPALAPSLDAWVTADGSTDRLRALVDRADRLAAAGGVRPSEARALADEATARATEASGLGAAFSDTLSEGTRAVGWGLVLAALGLGLGLVAVVGVPAVRVLRRLRAADGRYRQIVRHGTDIVTVLTPGGRILYESLSTEGTLGFEPESLVGRDALSLVHPDDLPEVQAHFAACLAGGGAQDPVRFRFARADGTWATLEGAAVNHLGDPSIRAVVASSRDVSDRVRAEAAQRARVEAEAARRTAEAEAAEATRRAAEATAAEAARAQAKAEEAQARAEELLRLKTSFLHNMSHELRTPLTAILGFAEVLAAEAAPPDRPLAEAIRRGGLRLQGTLDAVLEHARLEAGGVEVSAERVDVVACVAEAVARLRPVADEKGVALLAPAGPPVWTSTDVGALDRVVGHLVGNALKFTDDGAVTVTVGRRGGGVEVAVRDTGVGMSPCELARAFRAFEQASEGQARRHEGSGLGLAITERLVALVGGRVRVESEPGAGSVFRVWLPAEPQRAGDPVRDASGGAVPA